MSDDPFDKIASSAFSKIEEQIGPEAYQQNLESGRKFLDMQDAKVESLRINNDLKKAGLVYFHKNARLAVYAAVPFWVFAVIRAARRL